MKLTRWFPGDSMPVHAGVYERRSSGHRWYAAWGPVISGVQGHYWSVGALTVADADRVAGLLAPDQCVRWIAWRGCAA